MRLHVFLECLDLSIPFSRPNVEALSSMLPPITILPLEVMLGRVV